MQAMPTKPSPPCRQGPPWSSGKPCAVAQLYMRSPSHHGFKQCLQILHQLVVESDSPAQDQRPNHIAVERQTMSQIGGPVKHDIAQADFVEVAQSHLASFFAGSQHGDSPKKESDFHALVIHVAVGHQQARQPAPYRHFHVYHEQRLLTGFEAHILRVLLKFLISDLVTFQQKRTDDLVATHSFKCRLDNFRIVFHCDMF